MTKTNTAELRNLSESDISKEINEIRKELFDLRFQQATRQLNNTHRFKAARLKLAQLLTVQKEKLLSSSSPPPTTPTTTS